MDDLINRQAVLDEIHRWSGYLDDDMIYRIQWKLERIPPVEPLHATWLEQHLYPDDVTGHTYGTCSNCLEVRIVDNYCPNCGAKMEV